MCWIICVAVVVIFYFFIHFKIRNEVTERTNTFVIWGNESNEMDVPIERKIHVILSNESNEIDVSKDLRNESNEIDVSKDLSISPSCNFQINGKENSVLKRRHLCPLVPIREDLRKERNNSLNKVYNIDFGIINNKNKNKEDMNCFRKTGRFRQKFEGVEIDSAAIVSRRYRDIKLKTKNMPAPKPIKE